MQRVSENTPSSPNAVPEHYVGARTRCGTTGLCARRSRSYVLAVEVAEINLGLVLAAMLAAQVLAPVLGMSWNPAVMQCARHNSVGCEAGSVIMTS